METRVADAPLEVRELKKYFPVTRGFLKRILGWLKAVEGVSLSVAPGEIFGLVGESGCGKSTLGLHRPTAGEVRFEGRTVSHLPAEEVRGVRREIQYVYQDPGASLDPWRTVGRSIREPLVVHTALSRPDIRHRVEEIMAAVGLEPHHLQRYPHEFSGGQQRRLALACTLVLNPRLIIFDEPTAGLDVSVQATILRFFKQMQGKFHLAYLFISHDLGIIRLMCDRVTVMYLGAIVESGPTEAIFRVPTHLYTQALLAAVPKPEVGPWEGTLLQGEPPWPDSIPSGCRFRLRCPYAKDDPCAQLEPFPLEVSPGHVVACHLGDKSGAVAHSA
jgi:oligopeptide/dipeptide ABC transporter ATP-binding protein